MVEALPSTDVAPAGRAPAADVVTPVPDRPSAALDLQAAHLRQAYVTGALTPEDVVGAVYDRISARGDDHVWITLVPREDALARARDLDLRRRSAPDEPLPPLYGLPFAVKDNIDVAGLPTTAACPAFAYGPRESAPLVDRLLAAGAICVGKSNLDQFATGLSGVRSPYGTPRSPFGDLIPGGSSSGSGVAVAGGLVTFAIGTDTAGSGRVPAALTNTVGLKPSPGLVSTRGMVPACRSLDCPSVFALSVDDARTVLDVIAGFDPLDPFSRRFPGLALPTGATATGRRIGVIPRDQREFFGDHDAARAYEAGLDLLTAAGADLVDIDLTPFLQAGRLLYGGPWLAERTAGIGGFIAAHPGDVHPVTLSVLEPGAAITGADVFAGFARLRSLRRQVEAVLTDVDMIVVPTLPTTYTVAEIEADPVRLNLNLGRYTTFANLLDLAAVAVPTGFVGGRPFGITVLGPSGSDAMLCDAAADVHRRAGVPPGAMGHPLAGPAPSATVPQPVPPPPHLHVDGYVDLAVVGAHMSGLSLNHQLTAIGATLVRQTRTAPRYRLYALPGATPPRPGLVRVGDGHSIDAEVWRVPSGAVGSFLTGIPAPLAIGTVSLEDGDALGFLCESYAADGAVDISEYGGWRAYLATSTRPS